MNNNKISLVSRIKKLFFYDNETFTKYWEGQKKKGLMIYTAENVVWSILIFVFWSIVFLSTKGNYLGWNGEEAILAALFIGLFGGVIAAMIKWLVNEAKYSEIMNNSRDMK